MKSNQIRAGCIALIVGTPIAMLVQGAVLSKLWSWFIVPLGVTEITLPWALGISLVAYLLTSHSTDDYDNKSAADMVGTWASSTLVTPLLALALGFLYHGWMA